MARRGRGGLREGRNAEPIFVPTQAPVGVSNPTPTQLPPVQPAPLAGPGMFVMPGTTMDFSSLDLSNLNIPMPAPQPIPQPAPAPYVAPAPLPDFSSIPKPAPAPYADPAPVPQPRPQPIPQPVPQPIPAPAPPPPPPPVEVAPPPPPIPQISPEVLAQIQQEFNVPARNAPPPPVAPPVQVPPPVVQPEGIATLPQAPVEPPAPPVQVPPPVVQPEPLAGPGMPTPSGGFLSGIDLSNIDLSGLALPNQVQPAPEAVAPPPVVQPAPEPAPAPVFDNIERPFDPSLFSDPGLGGGPRGEPLPDTRGGDPTGIETMAESVGQGDYLGIPLPDGGTFDLSTLDLSSIGGEGGMGGFTPNLNLGELEANGFMSVGGEGGMGNVDPSLYSDPELGGGPRGEPLPNTRGGGPGFDPFAGVTGGLGPGGYGPEGGGFAPPYNTEPGFDPVEDVMSLPLYDENGNIVGEPEFNLGDIGFGPVGVEGGYSYDGNGNVINGGPAPGGEPVFNPPQGAIDEAQGTTYTGNNFTPDLSGIDVSNLDFSGLDLGDLNIGGEGGAGNNSYNPEDQGGPQGGPGSGNGPGNTMGGTDASGNGNTDTGSASTGGGEYDPQTGLNAYGLTPEQQAALDQWLADNPNGLDLGNIDFTGVNPGGTGNTGTGGDPVYTVDPVDPVGDLGTGDDAGSDPIDVTTPYVPPETRSASSYGLTGAVQTMPVAANPFRRPESQQGIGSLAGGG